MLFNIPKHRHDRQILVVAEVSVQNQPLLSSRSDIGTTGSFSCKTRAALTFFLRFFVLTQKNEEI
jgi:hypothetical protein